MDALASMKISSTEALNWLERAIKNSICLNDRMTQAEREQDKLHLAVNVQLAYAKVQSMLDTFGVVEQQKAEALMHHTWTTEALECASTPRARSFYRRVLSSAWLRITAGRLEADKL